MYRPGEWEQLPSERDLNPFSRYEALDQKRTIVLDDIESTLSETGNWCCETYTVSLFTTRCGGRVSVRGHAPLEESGAHI